MDTFDKLNQYEVLIKQFEFRINNDHFNYLIAISHEVIKALDEHGAERAIIEKKLSAVAGYTGTQKKDLQTLRVFDLYKRDVLFVIKKVKKKVHEDLQ